MRPLPNLTLMFGAALLLGGCVVRPAHPAQPRHYDGPDQTHIWIHETTPPPRGGFRHDYHPPRGQYETPRERDERLKRERMLELRRQELERERRVRERQKELEEERRRSEWRKKETERQRVESLREREKARREQDEGRYMLDGRQRKQGTEQGRGKADGDGRTSRGEKTAPAEERRGGTLRSPQVEKQIRLDELREAKRRMQEKEEREREERDRF